MLHARGGEICFQLDGYSDSTNFYGIGDNIWQYELDFSGMERKDVLFIGWWPLTLEAKEMDVLSNGLGIMIR
jgi:hypothetical protein